MANKFNKLDKKKLDNPKKRELIPPYTILEMLELKEGDKIADIGAGIGYFSIPASEVVGKKGIVYALDIELEMVEEIEKKISKSSIRNIRAIVTEETDFKINNNSVNVCLISFVVHEVNYLEDFVKELLRITEQDSNIFILDWEKRESELGPPVSDRLDKEFVREIMEKNNLKVSEIELNNEMYLLKCVKKFD